MMTLTLKEAFAGAFTAEADVLLTLVGVPDKAELTVMHVQPEDPDAATLDDADVAGNVTLNADMARIVDDGDTRPNGCWMMTGDGDKLNITVGFTAPLASTTDSVKLMFSLDATQFCGRHHAAS